MGYWLIVIDKGRRRSLLKMIFWGVEGEENDRERAGDGYIAAIDRPRFRLDGWCSYSRQIMRITRALLGRHGSIMPPPSKVHGYIRNNIPYRGISKKPRVQQAYARIESAIVCVPAVPLFSLSLSLSLHTYVRLLISSTNSTRFAITNDISPMTVLRYKYSFKFVI